jgi:hypothetical protein
MNGSGWFYDIHDTLTITSDLALPDWEYFASSGAKESKMPIRFRLDRGLAFKSQSPLTKVGIAYYFEQDTKRMFFKARKLGFEADLTLCIGDTIEVASNRAYKLLTTYYKQARFGIRKLLFDLVTLRFLMDSINVQYGGCASKGANGVLVAASSDTGKTSTIVPLAIEGFLDYLSDDMTLVRNDGTAMCLPDYRVLGFKKMRIARRTKIRSICFLQTGEKKTAKLEKEAVVPMLRSLNYYEYPWYANPAICTYAYASPLGGKIDELVMKEREITERFVDSVEDCYLVRGGAVDFRRKVLDLLR